MVALRNYDKKKALHHCRNYCTSSVKSKKIFLVLKEHHQISTSPSQPPSYTISMISHNTAASDELGQVAKYM